MLGVKIWEKQMLATKTVASSVVKAGPFMASVPQNFTSIGRRLVTRGEPRTALGNSGTAVLIIERESSCDLVG